MKRRDLLMGMGATLAVVGFDPVRKTWVTEAEAATCADFSGVPPLDGELLMDAATLQSRSRDRGQIVQQQPCAVLRPKSALDVQKMVQFCRARGIKLAPRGEGHTMYGQSLVAGLVIETLSLNKIHSINSSGAEVDAGVEWFTLNNTAFGKGFSVPVLTGYQRLTVGGTLSVGGISGTNRRGAQVDIVQWLDVVTGDGQLLRCSLTQNRELFEAVLGGLGQFGIITRAKVNLVPAKALARNYLLHYVDQQAFFRDLRILLNRGEMDEIYLIMFPFGTTLTYQINAIKFHNLLEIQNDFHLLRDLSLPPLAALTVDLPYLVYEDRVDVIYGTYQTTLQWEQKQKAWYDVFLPDSTVEQHLAEIIPSLTLEDVGPTGFVLLFPQKRSALKRPFMRLPEGDDEWVYLFDILTDAILPGQNPEWVSRMVARNRSWFEHAKSLGGKRYPIGVLDFDQNDWQEHYGELWPEVVRRKQLYDPDNILTPGPGIF